MGEMEEDSLEEALADVFDSDSDRMTAEWEAMLPGDDDVDYITQTRVLNRDEIDSLLGLEDFDERYPTAWEVLHNFYLGVSFHPFEWYWPNYWTAVRPIHNLQIGPFTFYAHILSNKFC